LKPAILAKPQRCVHRDKRVLKKGGYLLIISEMIKDGTYEVENAEVIAKTQVHLVALEETQRILRSASYGQLRFIGRENLIGMRFLLKNNSTALLFLAFRTEQQVS